MILFKLLDVETSIIRAGVLEGLGRGPNLLSPSDRQIGIGKLLYCTLHVKEGFCWEKRQHFTFRATTEYL